MKKGNPDNNLITALALGKMISGRTISVKEAVDLVFDRIAAYDGCYNSFISVCKEKAYNDAELIQDRINRGERLSPLAGVPMAIKDNISTKDILTTCGSKMLEHYRPPFDASAVTSLSGAGAIMIGKLNMDEFAMGSTSETSYFGAVKNPWDINRVPGGSSGGAAVAIATGMAYYSIGSDTGGSVRQPAAYCGVSAIKPTYGAVSRYGLIAYASSFDQIGPMARDARDLRAILDIIAVKDAMDSTSTGLINSDQANSEQLNSGSPQGIKIGIPTEYFDSLPDGCTKQRLLDATKTFQSLGCDVDYFSMPDTKYAVPAFYIIACAEAASNLSRFDGIKYGHRSENFDRLYELYANSRSEGFGLEVKRRIMLGNFVLSAGYYDTYYNKALQAKRKIYCAFNDAFKRFDFILTPVASTTAPRLNTSFDDPLKMYMNDTYTVSVNLSGLPAVSAPCGFDNGGLPVGMQLIGPAYSDHALLSLLDIYQQATSWHNQACDPLLAALVVKDGESNG